MSKTEQSQQDSFWSELKAPLLRLASFVLIVGIGFLGVRQLPFELTTESVEAYATHLGPKGGLYLFLAGVFSPLFFLPRWPVALLCGILFGVWQGGMLAAFASVLGAWLHFEVSGRFLGPFSDQLRKRYRLERFVIPKDREFTAILLLRAFPMSSFVATNLIAGALRINRTRYLLASILGMLPSTFLYAAGGKMLKHPSTGHILLAAGLLLAMTWGTWKAERLFQRWRENRRPDASP